MERKSQTYSIVVEMENAKSINEGEIGVSFRALAREIEGATTHEQLPRPDVIVVHSGQSTETPFLQQRLAELVPQLGAVADLVFSASTGSRWRFFFWRALVTGRDADCKYVALESPSRAARMLKAARRWFSTSRRVSGRILTRTGRVGMPVWQIPFALIVGLIFCTLVLIAQMAMALGLVRDEPEHVPAYVGHS